MENGWVLFSRNLAHCINYLTAILIYPGDTSPTIKGKTNGWKWSGSCTGQQRIMSMSDRVRQCDDKMSLQKGWISIVNYLARATTIRTSKSRWLPSTAWAIPIMRVFVELICSEIWHTHENTDVSYGATQYIEESSSVNRHPAIIPIHHPAYCVCTRECTQI